MDTAWIDAEIKSIEAKIFLWLLGMEDYPYHVIAGLECDRDALIAYKRETFEQGAA